MAKKGTKAHQPIRLNKKSKQVVLPKNEILGFSTNQATDIIKSKPENSKPQYPYTQVQLDWIKALREHPERQTQGSLGEKNPITGELRLCCLGQALLCLNPDIKFSCGGISLLDEGDDITASALTKSRVLINSYKKLNLRSSNGSLLKSYKEHPEKKGYSYDSLTEMNDHGFTWIQLADYIETNPENVFTNHIPNFYEG